MKIGFIGGGQMAQAMITGLRNQMPNQKIMIHGGSQHTADYAANAELNYVDSNLIVAQESDVIILACLPQHLKQVANEIKNVLNDQVIISVLGGISLATLTKQLGDSVLISRILPNTPVSVNLGTIAYKHGNQLLQQPEKVQQVNELVAVMGQGYATDEDQFSVFSALAGSSPAFIDLFIDAMAQAGVKHGVSKAQSVAIVAQTMLGTATQVLKSEMSPRDLATGVASPGGSTIAGFLAMEAAGFPTAVVAGIDATIAKDQSVD